MRTALIVGFHTKMTDEQALVLSRVIRERLEYDGEVMVLGNAAFATEITIPETTG